MPVNRDHKFMLSLREEEMVSLRYTSAREGFSSVAGYVRSRLGLTQEKSSGGARVRAGRPAGV
jgi:hypothetical protein